MHALPTEEQNRALSLDLRIHDTAVATADLKHHATDLVAKLQSIGLDEDARMVACIIAMLAKHGELLNERTGYKVYNKT